METLNILRQFPVALKDAMLQQNDGLDLLEKRSYIRNKNYGDLVFLNYSQIAPNGYLQAADECRGLVLTPYADWQVVSRGFDRFYNYVPGQPFDFENSVITEKVDGSYIQMFYFEARWYIGTRGTDGTGEVSPDCPYKSWEELVWNTLGFCTYKDFSNWMYENIGSPEGVTFLFELVSPWNRVVKFYEKPALYCLGFHEFDPESGKTIQWAAPKDEFELFSSLNNVKLPEYYEFNSYEKIKKAFEDFGSTDEGVVCWNPKTNERVKIKREQYLALHRFKDASGNMTNKRALEVVMAGEIDEVLVYFPEYKELLKGFKVKVDKFADEIKQTYENIKNIEIQKDFALQATKYQYAGILFNLRNGKCSNIMEMLQTWKIDKLMEVLKIG